MINNEQRKIIKHALRNGLFCGGSKDMDDLCSKGFMEFVGKKDFSPDLYYRATGAGRKALVGEEEGL